MKKKHISNYENLCEQWRMKFLNMDLSALRKKLPEIQEEDNQLTITHFGQKYYISKENGRITLPDGHADISATVQLNIYNLFWYSKDYAMLQNRWVPFRDVQGASAFAPAFQKNVLNSFALTFSGKMNQLQKAAEKIGGTKVPQGDVGYMLHAFDCIPMQYIFWDKDDEFAAQGNILFDYSVTNFIHVESTVALATEGVVKLAAAAGIEIQGNIFQM